MKGHTELVAMRKRGHDPMVVIVNAFKGSSIVAAVRTAQIEIPPGDRIARLDLRCVVGLPCIVMPGTIDSGWAERARAACEGAGAMWASIYDDALARAIDEFTKDFS